MDSLASAGLDAAQSVPVPLWTLSFKDDQGGGFNASDFRVYMALRAAADDNGQAQISTKDLAEAADLGPHTVKQVLARFRKLGVVSSERTYLPSGALGSCRYTLSLKLPQVDSRAPQQPEGASGDAGRKAKRAPITEGRRASVLRSGVCGYCGDARGPFVVDHRVPVARGGDNRLLNLVSACSACNQDKGEFTLEEWMSRRIAAGLPWPPAWSAIAG